MFNKIVIIVMGVFVALFSANNSESIDKNYFDNSNFYKLETSDDE